MASCDSAAGYIARRYTSLNGSVTSTTERCSDPEILSPPGLSPRILTKNPRPRPAHSSTLYWMMIRCESVFAMYTAAFSKEHPWVDSWSAVM